MAYIKIETLQYPVSEQDIRNEYPNTSFPVPFSPPEGFSPVLLSPTPEYNGMTQGYREVAPQQDSLGNWVQSFEVYDLDPEVISANEEAAKKANKAQAESLLAASDWSDKPSVTDTTKALHLVNAAEWEAYRDALRVIAVVPSVTVEWPVQPEEVWSV